VIVTCPSRNFVTLKIVTRSGVTGLGDATLNGRELAVASYLKDHLVPNLVGRDAGRIEDTWQFFYRGAYWRRGPVTMTAIAAVDVALWDILGKMSNQPLYQLLGGRSRDGVLVYGHANGKDIDECSAEVGKYIAQGYKAIRAQSGVPGIKKAYGISNLKNAYEPAESELPLETVWSTSKYLEFVPKLFERLRRDHGGEIELLHDVHHRLTPLEAARLGRSLEPYRLFWMEDGTPAENQKSFELVRKHTVTPLAVGEVFNSIWDCKHLIENQLIDYIRTTIVHGGGITYGLPRCHRSFAGMHGRGAAFRHLGPELRHPGVHEACAGDRRGLPARLHVPGWPALLRRVGGPRRRDRREAGREVSLQPEAAAGRTPRRRHDVGLVIL
jgi:mannonate dehydratase